MKDKKQENNMWKGFFLGIGAIILLVGVYATSGFVYGTLKDSMVGDYKEQWACTSWKTPCGVVTTRGYDFNGQTIPWENFGCPLQECHSFIKTKVSTKNVTVTQQPDTTILQQIYQQLQQQAQAQEQGAQASATITPNQTQ